jgi:hypothetical protein
VGWCGWVQPRAGASGLGLGGHHRVCVAVGALVHRAATLRLVASRHLVADTSAEVHAHLAGFGLHAVVERKGALLGQRAGVVGAGHHARVGGQGLVAREALNRIGETQIPAGASTDAIGVLAGHGAVDVGTASARIDLGALRRDLLAIQAVNQAGVADGDLHLIARDLHGAGRGGNRRGGGQGQSGGGRDGREKLCRHGALLQSEP